MPLSLRIAISLRKQLIYVLLFLIFVFISFDILITRETIEEVKNQDGHCVDVISDFVSLKKSGQNYKALSPFNNEKTPSFFVVPAKGIFKDFSSGKGGERFTYVRDGTREVKLRRSDPLSR